MFLLTLVAQDEINCVDTVPEFVESGADAETPQLSPTDKDQRKSMDDDQLGPMDDEPMDKDQPGHAGNESTDEDRPGCANDKSMDQDHPEPTDGECPPGAAGEHPPELLAIITPPTPPPTQLPRPQLPPKNLAYVQLTPAHRKRLVPSADTLETSNSESGIGCTWMLEASHPGFLFKAQEFLLNVPGGNTWKKLLAKYIQFEKFAPQVSPQLSYTFYGG